MPKTPRSSEFPVPVFTIEDFDSSLQIDTATRFESDEAALAEGFELIIAAQRDLDDKFGEMTQLQRFAKGYSEVGLVEHKYENHYDVYGKRAEQTSVRTGRLRRLLGGKATRD